MQHVYLEFPTQYNTVLLIDCIVNNLIQNLGYRIIIEIIMSSRVVSIGDSTRMHTNELIFSVLLSPSRI